MIHKLATSTQTTKLIHKHTICDGWLLVLSVLLGQPLIISVTGANIIHCDPVTGTYMKEVTLALAIKWVNIYTHSLAKNTANLLAYKLY